MLFVTALQRFLTLPSTTYVIFMVPVETGFDWKPKQHNKDPLTHQKIIINM